VTGFVGKPGPGRGYGLPALASHLMRFARRSSVRFLIVGGVSLAVDTGLLFLLHGVAGILLPVATALAFSVAFVVNFALNHLWAFESSVGLVGRRMLRYLALVTANLVVTVVSVSVLTTLGLPYLVAKVLCTGLLFIVNYLVSKAWVYNYQTGSA
jgi:putative flippase GtrA